MLTPASFFYLPFQAFSQNAQPSRNAGMIFGDWGFAQQAKSVQVLPEHCLPLVSPCVPHAFGVSFRNAFG